LAAPGAAGSQLGIVKETTYATAVAVTRFYLPESESLAVETQEIKYRPFNTMVQRSDMRRQVVIGAGGDMKIPVSYKGMGLLLQQIFGSSVSAQVGATTEYTQTHVLDEATGGLGMHATVQVGRSQSDGTVTPFTYDGCKVKSATFSCEEGGFLTLEVTWVCRNAAHSGSSAFALQTASYATSNPPFAWDEAAVTLNSVVRTSKSFSLTLERSMDEERRGLGTPLRRQALINGEWAVTGALDVEFENLTDYAAFIAGTNWPLSVIFTSLTNIPSASPSASNPFKLTFTIPTLVLTGDPPNVSGEGLIRMNLPFEVEDNGTDNPITVVQNTSDTAL
jgi:hypothetical protein